MLDSIIYFSLFQNRVLDYLISIVIFLAGFLFLRLFKSILFLKLKKLASKTRTNIDDIIITQTENKIFPLLYITVFYFSIQNLKINPGVMKSIRIACMAIAAVSIVSLIMYIFNYFLNKFWMGDSSEDRTRRVKIVMAFLKVIIYVAALLIVLDNAGVKISTLIAGLGIGGIAITFASQAILADLFSFFVIIFDRPFEIGDFIIMGEYLGTIEYIGIKTTRVRSLSGEQIIVSNSALVNAQLRNYKRMQQRRVVFNLSVTYDTSHEKLKEIPSMIKSIIQAVKDTRFDRAHFFSFGDSALNIEIVYYVLSSDYNKYMDIQQEINFKINEEFVKNNIEFAFPTQTLYVHKNS